MGFKKDLLHFLILVAGKQKDKEQSNKTREGEHEQLSSEDDGSRVHRTCTFSFASLFTDNIETWMDFSALIFWFLLMLIALNLLVCFNATGTQEDGSTEQLSSDTFSAPCCL